jgi:PAS domain-containing protein
MRALNACGDGFWEFDLLDGSAWFSEWFYRKLNWSSDTKRALLDFRPILPPAEWDKLMAQFRAHLEQGVPLDVELRVEVAGQSLEWWHIRGSAQRNDAGQPVYLAGSAREVSADRRRADQSLSLLCVSASFDALPVAAALLDAQSAVLKANRLWRELPENDAGHAIAQLQAANPRTEVELSWHHDAGGGGSARRLRLQAAPFEHDGSRHLVVTLEDR